MSSMIADCPDLQNICLDLIAEREGLTSDYQIAKFLGVPLPSIRNYRNNKTQMDETMCVQCAELLKIDPMQLIARVKINRDPTERTKDVWGKYLGRVLLAGMAIALFSPQVTSGNALI